MNEQILRRKALQIAYENKNKHQFGIVELNNFDEFQNLDYNLLSSITRYLRDSGLIEFIATSSISMVKITSNGIRVYENKYLLNELLPIYLPETDETQRLVFFVEEFLKSDDRYQGILNDFDKSYNYLYGEIKDWDNAARDIVLSLEGLSNLLLNTRKKTLEQLKNKLLDKFGIQQNLASVIQGVCNFRGDKEGAFHSSGENIEVEFDEAEFIFNVCCSIIIMIARRSGYELQ